MIFLAPRPPEINKSLPVAEQARRRIWNCRYTVRVVEGLARDPRVDQREARKLVARAKELLKRAKTTLAMVTPTAAANAETPETIRAVDDRAEIRRDKVQEASGPPPDPRNAPRRLLQEAARQAAKAANDVGLTPTKYDLPSTPASVFAEATRELVLVGTVAVGTLLPVPDAAAASIGNFSKTTPTAVIAAGPDRTATWLVRRRRAAANYRAQPSAKPARHRRSAARGVVRGGLAEPRPTDPRPAGPGGAPGRTCQEGNKAGEIRARAAQPRRR